MPEGSDGHGLKPGKRRIGDQARARSNRAGNLAAGQSGALGSRDQPSTTLAGLPSPVHNRDVGHAGLAARVLSGNPRRPGNLAAVDSRMAIETASALAASMGQGTLADRLAAP